MSPPYIILLPLNDTFEPKTIKLPYLPDVIRIGRQTNKHTIPYRDNAFFDSKVLSRAHAELWASADGRACIKDIRSSNGTFVNGIRLSKENEESEVRELLPGDTLELGIDILNDETGTIIHRKVSARVDHAGPVEERKERVKNVTYDMVIKRLTNDLKVSRQVGADLKHTTARFYSRDKIVALEMTIQRERERIKRLEGELVKSNEANLDAHKLYAQSKSVISALTVIIIGLGLITFFD